MPSWANFICRFALIMMQLRLLVRSGEPVASPHKEKWNDILVSRYWRRRRCFSFACENMYRARHYHFAYSHDYLLYLSKLYYLMACGAGDTSDGEFAICAYSYLQPMPLFRLPRLMMRRPLYSMPLSLSIFMRERAAARPGQLSSLMILLIDYWYKIIDIAEDTLPTPLVLMPILTPHSNEDGMV